MRKCYIGWHDNRLEVTFLKVIYNSSSLNKGNHDDTILKKWKCLPRFYRVMETRVEVWKNKKCCWNTSHRQVFPQLFQVLPNFHECFYNSIETRRTCFIFLLKNTVTRKRKQLVNFDYQIVNYLCSRHHCVKQLELVLCLHRVIAALFLTNQRACVRRTVF